MREAQVLILRTNSLNFLNEKCIQQTDFFKNTHIKKIVYIIFKKLVLKKVNSLIWNAYTNSVFVLYKMYGTKAFRQ